jgi:hypothetical protein
MCVPGEDGAQAGTRSAVVRVAGIATLGFAAALFLLGILAPPEAALPDPATRAKSQLAAADGWSKGSLGFLLLPGPMWAPDDHILPPTNAAIDARPDTGTASGSARVILTALAAEDADVAAQAFGPRHKVVATPVPVSRGEALAIADVLEVEIGRRSAQWDCLTRALYFEARGEDLAGQVAVAEVILNRVDSPAYPDSVCAVVRQGETLETGCQFSFMCDGQPETIANRPVYEELGKVAWAMLQGFPRILTGEATNYHATSVSPRWAARLQPTARIGAHIFYRRKMELAEQ